MPAAPTTPNITSAAPPSAAAGIEAKSAPIFGTSATAHSIRPQVATTQRLRTPVTITSPTFSMNAIYGKAANMPPIALARPLARRPLVASRSLTGRLTRSPIAMNSPIDSTICTSITIVIVTIAPISNTGRPKANGCTIVNHGARRTSAKSPMPSAVATAAPASRPISTDRLRRNSLP